MAISFTNDSATISTTEYSLPADTTTGVPTSQTDDCLLEAWIDFGAMVAGDQYRVRVYEKVNGGTQRVVYAKYLDGVQSELCVLPKLELGEGWDVTVLRLAGTDRSIGWSLRKDGIDVASAVETGYTIRGLFRLIGAAVAGKSSGGGTVYRNLADSKARITATVDGSGNRTAVTHDTT